MNVHQYFSEIYFKGQYEEIVSALSGPRFEALPLLRDIFCMLFSTLRWFRCCSVFCSASYNFCPFSCSSS
jgi:hypothetical protein